LLQPIRTAWNSKPRAIRELAILAAALAFGVFVMPLIIYAAGRETLGEYANGGASAMMLDFFRGLADGARAFWTVALGPYAAIQLVRLALTIGRRPREDRLEA
jgi:hypothetical protein